MFASLYSASLHLVTYVILLFDIFYLNLGLPIKLSCGSPTQLVTVSALMISEVIGKRSGSKGKVMGAINERKRESGCLGLLFMDALEIAL